ncbi:uncharacterized protein LOC34617560 [Cyclospora cayetanensis]|uniref:Uncharacterized protein LOC34617560 n=1 Tax=Cyclospora cayetanensis TaxID=88456 RepID=A0A6P6RZF2_9EIME|nr:uncharacterized protein LOC34617560 [Cyclospora cayetanensis]
MQAESLTADEAAEFVYELLTDLRNAALFFRRELYLYFFLDPDGRPMPRAACCHPCTSASLVLDCSRLLRLKQTARNVKSCLLACCAAAFALPHRLRSTLVYARKGLVPPAATRRQIYAQWGLGAAVRIQLARDLEVRILRRGNEKARKEGEVRGGDGRGAKGQKGQAQRETARDGGSGKKKGGAERDIDTAARMRLGVGCCWLSASKWFQLSRFFEALVAAGASPVRSGLFLLNELQAALKGVSSPGPIEPADLALALCAAERGTLTNKTLRLYAAALSRGDPNAKQLLTEEPVSPQLNQRAISEVARLETNLTPTVCSAGSACAGSNGGNGSHGSQGPRAHLERALRGGLTKIYNCLGMRCRHRPGTLLGKLLSLHPGLCPLKARHLIDNALASQTQKKDTNITQPGALG